MKLGISTTTDDLEGEIIATAPVSGLSCQGQRVPWNDAKACSTNSPASGTLGTWLIEMGYDVAFVSDRDPRMTQDLKRRSSTSQPSLMPETLLRHNRMKVRDVIKRLSDDGWYLDRTKGSHRVFKHPTKPEIVVVAGNSGTDVPTGTLKNIWRQAQLEENS